MITAQTPPKFVMLGNQVPLTLTTDKYLQVVGVKAQTDLAFNAHLADGTKFNIAWMGTDINLEFTVLDAPTDSANDIQRNVGLSVHNWVTNHVLPAFLANPILTAAFSITNPANGVIKFTALNAGPQYSLTMPVKPATMGFFNTQNGVSPVYDEQLRILLNVEYRKLTETTFKRLEYKVSPNAGKTQFLINQLLSLDDVDLPLPSLSSNTAQDVSKGALEFKLSYTEIFGQTLLANKLQFGANNHVAFAGGLKDKDYATLDLETKFNTYFNWLTWYPAQISISPTQPFFLHWFTPSAGVSFELQATITFTDGTTQIRTLYTVNNANKHRVWAVPLGLDAALSSLNLTKQVASYRVHWYQAVLNGSPIRSPYITITIDRKKYLDETHLLYRNSWGFFEVARLTGIRETAAKINTDEHNRQLPFNYSVNDRSGRNMASSYQLIDTLYSGFKTKTEMDHLMDLLRSEDIRLIEGTYARPVILEPDNVAMYDTESGRNNAASFKIKEQSTGKYYSDGRYSS